MEKLDTSFPFKTVLIGVLLLALGLSNLYHFTKKPEVMVEVDVEIAKELAACTKEFNESVGVLGRCTGMLVQCREELEYMHNATCPECPEVPECEDIDSCPDCPDSEGTVIRGGKIVL